MAEKLRLAVLSSHPIQYYGPLFRELAGRVDLHVFFAHRPTPQQQADAGFGQPFDWDVDLTSGYDHSFLENTAAHPGVDHFGGCDTPGVGEALRAGTFDGVLVFGWFLKTFIQATWAAKRLGLPVLVRGDSQLETPRVGPKRVLKQAAYPLLLRAFDAALYVGDRSKAYYEHYGYPRERLFASPHCVDTGYFAKASGPAARTQLRQSLGIRPDEKVVLFAGKLLPFKRPLDAVEICARGGPFRIMVAGSGELELALRARAEELGVRLDLLGFQNQSQMPACYAAADVLVLPSDGRETWGLVCNEALACGTPILVSQAAGCAADLAAGGATYPMGDIAAGARKLDEVYRNPPAREVIAQINDRHSLASAARGVVGALEHVSRPVRGDRRFSPAR